MQPSQKEWEKKFNEKMKENYFVIPSSHLNVVGIKDFISQALSSQKAELVEKVNRLKPIEGMRNGEMVDTGFLEKDEVISLIKE